jgi:hypothetical protein
MSNGAGFFSPSNEAELQKLIEKEKEPKLTSNQEEKLQKLFAKRDAKTITENQLAELNRLKAKKAGPKLTPPQLKRKAELEAKKKAPFQLSETAKRFVEEVWLQKEFGYSEPLVTKETLKGQICEQDSINLLSKVFPLDTFRAKNKKTFYNEWVSGTPDLILRPKYSLIEDVKSSYTIKTFAEIIDADPIYFGQGQSYMWLTNTENFALHYCLVPTPEELVLEMEKSMFFKFGCDESNPYYIEACEKIRNNHIHAIEKVPIDQRVKTFIYQRDEEYIRELKYRIGKAREYYETLTLNGIKSKDPEQTISGAVAFYDHLRASS